MVFCLREQAVSERSESKGFDLNINNLFKKIILNVIYSVFFFSRVILPVSYDDSVLGGFLHLDFLRALHGEIPEPYF